MAAAIPRYAASDPWHVGTALRLARANHDFVVGRPRAGVGAVDDDLTNARIVLRQCRFRRCQHRQRTQLRKQSGSPLRAHVPRIAHAGFYGVRLMEFR